MSTEMRSGFVTVHNVPSRVVTCGGWLDEAFSQPGPKEMVFIIPGNPGLTGYYEEFVQAVHKAVKMPVWILNHAGHEVDENVIIPSVKDYPQLFDLSGQITHKVEFMKKYIPEDVKIHLVGHSVGSYIILNILKKKLINHTITMNYLLFPAVERIGITPNATLYNFFANYFLWLILILACIFRLLPTVIGRTLVSIYFLMEGTNLKNVTTTMHIIHPVVLRNIFFLATDEMNKILELDEETIVANNSKLQFFYGKIDGWCPIQYYHDLKERLPQVNAIASTTDVRHAFVLNSSQEVAQLLSEWILEESSK